MKKFEVKITFDTTFTLTVEANDNLDAMEKVLHDRKDIYLCDHCVSKMGIGSGVVSGFKSISIDEKIDN